MGGPGDMRMLTGLANHREQANKQKSSKPFALAPSLSFYPLVPPLIFLDDGL